MNSYNQYAAVTPSDTDDGPFTPNTPVPNLFTALYIGGAGDVEVADPSNNLTVFAAVPAGTILTVMGRRVNNALTTATNIVALRNV